jgi:hypothetical protein
MKKIIFIIIALCVVFTVEAQVKNKWHTATTVTSVSATPVYFTLPVVFQLGQEFSVGGTLTQDGGTSEGTIRLESSMTGAASTYITVNDTFEADLYWNDNDTITVKNGKEFMFYLSNTKAPYYRLAFIGGSSDTTSLVPVWQYK